MKPIILRKSLIHQIYRNHFDLPWWVVSANIGFRLNLIGLVLIYFCFILHLVSHQCDAKYRIPITLSLYSELQFCNTIIVSAASAPAAHLSLGASKRSSQSNLFIRIWYFLASFKQFKTFLQQNLFRSFQVYRSSFVCCFNKECNSIQYGKVIISLRHFREKFSYTLQPTCVIISSSEHGVGAGLLTLERHVDC